MSATFLAEVSLAADPRLIRGVRLLISSLAADRGLSMDEIEDLKLAVQEACVNRLALGLAQDRLRIEIRDDQNTLVIAVSGDRPGPGNEDEEAALGLSLAEALVDGVWTEDVGGTERVVLRKSLSPPPVGPAS